MTTFKIITSKKPTRPNFRDLSGQTFGDLTVSHFLGQGTYGRCIYSCICSCGNVCEVQSNQLYQSRVRSCGCNDTKRPRQKHGLSGSKLYATWRRIMQRTENPKHVFFANYGGRGIKVCNRWKSSFLAFVEDMGTPPTDNHTIDRLDSDGDYTPDNCRWATRAEQARNRRDNIYVTHQGQTRSVIEWAETFNVSSAMLARRLRNGWTMERATTKPLKIYTSQQSLN